MKRVILCLLVLGAAHALAFRESWMGAPAFWLCLGGAYAALTAVSLHYLWDQGTLVDRLSPRWGDLSIGAMVALVLLFASWLGRSALAPTGTPRQAWLLRIYLQLGDPEVLQHSVVLTLALIAIAAAEEIVWRGMVLDIVTARFGERLGWIVSALLYAAALVPTAFVLRTDDAGPNPLLPIAGLGAGLIWNFLAGRLHRLPPVMVSHIAFTYFTAVQFRWPGT
jgi:membrane protease YdiL (CAAX protease family)